PGGTQRLQRRSVDHAIPGGPPRPGLEPVEQLVSLVDGDQRSSDGVLACRRWSVEDYAGQRVFLTPHVRRSSSAWCCRGVLDNEFSMIALGMAGVNSRSRPA